MTSCIPVSVIYYTQTTQNLNGLKHQPFYYFTWFIGLNGLSWMVLLIMMSTGTAVIWQLDWTRISNVACSYGWQLMQAFGRKFQWAVDQSSLIPLHVDSPYGLEFSQDSGWVPKGVVQGKKYSISQWTALIQGEGKRLSTSWGIYREGRTCWGILGD